MSASSHYYDPVDGTEYPLVQPRWRSGENRPLLITPSVRLRREDIDTGTRSLWRCRATLPLRVTSPITLSEGCTPLVASTWESSNALFKLEWFCPSGSFKDRGASVMLSVLRESKGGTVAVTEERIIAAKQQLAAQGLFAEPTSATAAAALTTLRAEGSITADETVMVVLTGSGWKGAAQL